MSGRCFEVQRSVPGALTPAAAASQRIYSYAGNTVDRVSSLSMVCSDTFSTVAPTFDPSRSTIQTCWPCSNGPRAITLSKTPSSVAGLSSTSIQIASVSPKSASNVRLSSTFGLCMNPECLFPLEVFDARSFAECVSACKRCSKCFDQFARLRDVGLCLVAFENAIQEPDNETVGQQDERTHQTRPMPKMADLNRD